MKIKDQIQLGPETAPGERTVLRRRGEKVSKGVLSPLVEGKPLVDGSELVYVGEPDEDGWRDMETLYQVRATSDGPAQVATPAYREGYDRIFGKKPSVGVA